MMDYEGTTGQRLLRALLAGTSVLLLVIALLILLSRFQVLAQPAAETADPELEKEVNASVAAPGDFLTYTITMYGDGAVKATFTQDEYTLTINVVGDGAVLADPDRPTYSYGEVVTLTAIPGAGWNFAGWSGDLSGGENPGTITMNGNRAVTATFTQDEYTLTVNVVGGGLVDVDPAKPTYGYGEVVTLTATADPGWAFDHWSGDLSFGENPETITMYGNRAVTATFTQEEYTLALNVVGEGSVTVEPDQHSYHYGDVVTLTASADPGWNFVGWSGDVGSTNNPHLLTISGNTTVTATFVWSTPPGADPYEPDDTCAQASALRPDGTVQQHTFHQHADEDWARFTVVSDTTYVVQATSTSPGADLMLELYDACGGNLEGADDNALGNDARLIFTAPSDGTYYVKAFNQDPAIYGPDVTYELSVRAQTPGGVVLIVAGHDDNYRYQANILYAANRAYRTFLGGGIPESNVRYLSAVDDDDRTDADGDGVSDVYASSASANVEAAVTTWAANPADSHTPFYLYLVDHGLVDVFKTNGDADTITPDDLSR